MYYIHVYIYIYILYLAHVCILFVIVVLAYSSMAHLSLLEKFDIGNNEFMTLVRAHTHTPSCYK